MQFVVLAQVFAVAVTIHNLEEAVFLPGWSRRAGRWHPRVGGGEFRFAVLVLTLAAYVCVWLAAMPSIVGTYLLCGYAFAMLVNVFIPHTFASLALRRYAPGTATALLLMLPSTGLLLRAALAEHRIEPWRLAWVGPAGIAVLLLSIRPLFAIGRALFGGAPPETAVS